jgi:hypothetical protein
MKLKVTHNGSTIEWEGELDNVEQMNTMLDNLTARVQKLGNTNFPWTSYIPMPSVPNPTPYNPLQPGIMYCTSGDQGDYPQTQSVVGKPVVATI